MRHRRFTPDGPEVSEVGLGTWQLGGTESGDVSEETALDVLRSAVERGITFFDTADIYGGGRSERLIGRFLAESKAGVFVATKLGRRPDAGWPENFTAEAVRRHTEESLERLRTDALDLTQLHCISKDVMADGEVFEHLRGRSMAQLALRWCLDHDAVTVVIPGAKSREQVFQNATASDLEPLGDEVHAELRRFYEGRVREHIRGPY